MERLRGLDGAFLALESPTTHLHLLGTLVLDPSGAPGGLGFRRLRSAIGERLERVPPFRQRMLEVPFGLQHPVLVDDPGFDLDYHVRRTAVPAPGGPNELAGVVAEIAARPLDRHRPLWEFHVVEGLDRGRTALVAKVHHAIIDGVSGAEVLASFFDLSPDPSPRPLFRSAASPGPGGERPPPDAGGGDPGPGWSPPPLPGEADQWRQVVADLPGHVDAVARGVTRTVRAARALAGRGRMGGAAPPTPFEAPRTSFNRAISPHRRVAFADLSRSDVRRVTTVLGGTANDVVLAATAGGLRTVLSGRDEDVETSLVALVPVSVRTEEERGALGNRVSGMLVSLATGVVDPVARYRRIRDGARAAKERHRTLAPDLVASWGEAALPVLATRLTRLVTNVRLFDHVSPVCNVIVSNVPGPEVPLYLAGARLEALFPLGPIVEGVGINVTVFSYLDAVHVGVQACWDLMPDIGVLARGMEEALAELVAATDRHQRPVPWWHGELPA